ncbi:MAG: TrkH family potassium uptake protein [Microcystaceae cyanobacterium]
MTIARTICLGFFTVIMVGTLLLMLPISTQEGIWTGPVNALFTATSAVCVTGLAVFDTGTYFSFWGQLIILLLIQIGGLGYMATMTFLLSLIRKRLDLQQKIAVQESFDRQLMQGSRQWIRSIVGLSLVFEIGAMFFLFQKFSEDFPPLKALWLSIFHSISAWNNAGFSLFSNSLEPYKNSFLINAVISVIVIVGGIGYDVILESYFWLTRKIKNSRQRFNFSLNFKVATSTTIFLLLLGMIIFFGVEINNPNTLATLSLKDKLLTAWFQSMTTRTAGFNSIDIGNMTISGILITMVFMFIGASPGGTGGGIKTTTLRIIANSTRTVLQGESDVILYQRSVPKSLILKAMAVVFGSVMTMVCVMFVITFVEFNFNPDIQADNVNSIRIFFEVISAFATVGLSMGITASFSTFAKFMLVLTMYTGRVGILLLITAIVGESPPKSIQYPEENLLIG